MAHRLRAKVTRRDGTPFPGARVALGPRGSPGAPVATGPGGEAMLPLPASAARLFLIIDPPAAGGAGFGAAWETNDTAFWTLEIELDWNPGLPRLLRMTPEWMVVRESKTSSPSGTLFDLEVRMTRVREVDNDIVQDVLRKVYGDPAFSYPDRPGGPDLPFAYATSPLFTSGTRVLANKSETNPTPAYTRTAWLFEVAPRRTTGDKEETAWGPKLCGAYFPRDVRVKDFSPPFLIYFAPEANQDFTGGTTLANTFIDRATRYANAGYYFDMRFFRTFDYLADPWIPNRLFAMGLRHQIRAAGRRMGVIAPVPEAFLGNHDYGRCAEPEFLAELCAEVVAYGFVIEQQAWIEGVLIPPPPAFGRVAAGAFSNGNGVMASFLSKLGSAASSNPLKAKLREVYLMDPPDHQAGAVLTCQSFLATLPAADVALRHYAKFTHSVSFASDVRTAVDPGWKLGEPFDATSERAATPPPGLPHRTNAFLPTAAWPTTPTSGLEMHSMIPGTMFTHALRLSQFPVR